MQCNATASPEMLTRRGYRRAGLCLAICLAVLCLLVGILLLGVGRVRAGSPALRYVVPGGADNGACTDADVPCATVQYAIDQAASGDEIHVAAGTYTATANSVAVISKTVTLLGGWDAAFVQRDPASHTTVLDAQRQGPAIHITGAVSPTIDGFTITGGNGSSVDGQGGGIHSRGADLHITGCVITDNVAYIGTFDSGYGGGIYLQGATAAVISGNVVISNAANISSSSVQGPPVSILGGGDFGGGLYVLESTATISNNRVVSNTASLRIGQGGGIALLYSPDTLLSHNDVQGNVGGGTWGSGGGIFVLHSAAIVQSNWVWNNVASVAGAGRGGGLFVYGDGVILDGNQAISNTATLNATAVGRGGGVYLVSAAPFTASNNVVARNHATTAGGGMWIDGTNHLYPIRGLLVNNTLAENDRGAGGEGVVVAGVATLTLTNNIVVSHTVGITFSGVSGSIVASHNLFDGNASDPFIGTYAVFGSPRFVDPQAWDYHLQADSAAINRGTMSCAPLVDIDGEPRPDDCFVDIGADEFSGSTRCKRMFLPLILRLFSPTVTASSAVQY